MFIVCRMKTILNVFISQVNSFFIFLSVHHFCYESKRERMRREEGTKKVCTIEHHIEWKNLCKIFLFHCFLCFFRTDDHLTVSRKKTFPNYENVSKQNLLFPDFAL